MKPNRAKPRKQKSESNAEPIRVLQYFFKTERKNGQLVLDRGRDGQPILRTDPVTRAELWNILDWFWRKTIKLNAWYRRLGRWLRGLSLGRLNPFAIVRSSPVPIVVAPAEEEDGGSEPTQPARKQFDASGKPIE